MATSAVSGFIEEPSVAWLEALRVEDLHAIADLYGLTVLKAARKAELLAPVGHGLVEKGLLVTREKEEEEGSQTHGLSPDRASSAGSTGASPASVTARLKMRMARLEVEIGRAHV